MHKHERIRDDLLAEIVKLPADTQLPHERHLAAQFGTSRTTVRQALAGLANANKIYAVRGRGTFVAPQTISKGLQLTSFTEDMQNRGLVASTRVISAEEIRPDDNVAQQLELNAGSTVFKLHRLRLADGSPMCLETIHLPARLVPRLLGEDLEQSLYQLLATRYSIRVVRADQTISAAVADECTHDLLGVPEPAAVIAVTRRGFDEKGRVIEYGFSAYRSDRYDFRVTVVR